jgi:hypothetical protein
MGQSSGADKVWEEVDLEWSELEHGRINDGCWKSLAFIHILSRRGARFVELASWQQEPC